MLVGVSEGATGSGLGGCLWELGQSLESCGRKETRTDAFAWQVCSWENRGGRCAVNLGLEANFCYFVLSAWAVLTL